MSVRGFAVGSLALIALEVLVQPSASDKAGGLLTKSSELLAHVLSPSKPGLHWFAGTSSSSSGAAAGTPAPSTPSAVVVSAGPQNSTIDQFVNAGPVRTT